MARSNGKGVEQMLQNVPGEDLALVYKELDMSVYFLLFWNNLKTSGGGHMNSEKDRKSSAEMLQDVNKEEPLKTERKGKHKAKPVTLSPLQTKTDK